MYFATIFRHSPQPRLLKAELLVDHSGGVLPFRSDMSYCKQKPFLSLQQVPEGQRRRFIWNSLPDHFDARKMWHGRPLDQGVFSIAGAHSAYQCCIKWILRIVSNA